MALTGTDAEPVRSTIWRDFGYVIKMMSGDKKVYDSGKSVELGYHAYNPESYVAPYVYLYGERDGQKWRAKLSIVDFVKWGEAVIGKEHCQCLTIRDASRETDSQGRGHRPVPLICLLGFCHTRDVSYNSARPSSPSNQ
jgi:hypothetical protein